MRQALLAAAASLLVLLPGHIHAQEMRPPDAAAGAATAADQIADIFSELGDQLYEDCIFELSQEQVDVQAALIQAYIQQGASGPAARKLAAAQIQPPKLSAKCEQVRHAPASPASSEVQEASPEVQEASPETQEASPEPQALQPDTQVASPGAKPAPETQPTPETQVATETPPEKPEAPPTDWTTTTVQIPKKPVIAAAPKAVPEQPPPVITLAGKQGLAQWDCADGVDYVTIHLNGYARKLTGGEICNPFQDVVREVPASLPSFRFGYTIKTGRLFVIAEGSALNGQTVAWGLSGRDVCRNNPDPDCFAARAIGPLPPGEYTFASDRNQRVSWGPRTKRHVAGIYLKKLWNKERFSPQHTAAILKRGNIAIHVRLKGEMSEACIGLEPKGWAYVASLIKDGRATGLNVYIDEPHPQVAEAPPVIVASSFSLTSLFK